MKTTTVKTFRTLSILAVMLITFSVNAQTHTDFWSCFETVTNSTELQLIYPDLNQGETRSHILMDHGISIPNQNGVLFQNGMTVNVEDKASVLSNNRTAFFIIREAKCSPTEILFIANYYYNFSGNYDQFKSINMKLNLVNGIWTVTNSTIQ